MKDQIWTGQIFEKCQHRFPRPATLPYLRLNCFLPLGIPRNWESPKKSGLQLHHHCFSIIFAFILARNQGGPIPHFHMVFAVRRAECTQQYAQCSTGAAQCGHASTEPGGVGDGGFSLADLIILNSSGKTSNKIEKQHPKSQWSFVCNLMML